MSEKMIFGLLSQLMDETTVSSEGKETVHLSGSDKSVHELEKHNTEMLERLGSFRCILDENLVPSIERVNYRNKFNIIRQLKELGNDISLYIFFPELSDKTAVCFYQPTKADLSSLRSRIGTDETIISAAIPTIYCSSSEPSAVSCLNLAEKRIWFRKEDYIRLISEADEKDIDISGLAEAALVHADKISASQIIMTMPKKTDSAMKHRTSLCHSADVLVIRQKALTKDVLEGFERIRHLIIIDKSSNGISDELTSECRKRKLTPVYVNKFPEALDKLKDEKYSERKVGYSFKERMELCLYEIMWYLANRKKELNIPIERINEDLLYKSENDEAVTSHITKLRDEYSKQIADIDKLYSDFRSVSDDLENALDGIVSGMNISEVSCSDPDIILELIIKKCAAFSEYPVQGCREHIRELCDRYKALTGGIAGDILYNEFLGKKVRHPVKAAFISADSENSFVKHKKIELCENVPEMSSSCADLALSLGNDIGNTEKRVLGKYYINTGHMASAEKYLLDALENGDILSGEIYADTPDLLNLRNLQKNNSRKSIAALEELADMGVGAAAMKIGKTICERVDMNIYSSEDDEYKRCMKYLKLAAAQGFIDAIKLLGDIHYKRFLMSTYASADKAAAIYYYALADSKGSVDKKMFEKLGSLYYLDMDYSNCMEYCFKVETAAANYYIGLIYKNGYGVSVNKDHALTYFEKAASAGHAEAQVEYEKLNAEIAAQQAKTTTSSQSSYTSYSYYSGYYSSYYSGW